MKLTKLALVSFDHVYAELLENGKIRHYTIGHQYVFADGRTPDEIVKERIAHKYGINASDILIKSEPVTHSLNIKRGFNRSKEPSKNKKELKRNKSKHFVYQYEQKIPNAKYYHIAYEWLTKKFNTLIWKVNTLINKIFFKFNKKLEHDSCFEEPTEYFGKSKYGIPYIPVKPTHIRRCVGCSYLSIAFTEDQVEDAIKVLQVDLKNLSDKNLIIGHMMMPSMMPLADMVGDGKKNYALFCFLFVDSYKLCELFNIELFKLPNLPLKNILGVISEGGEGFIGFDMRKDVEIEKISLDEEIRNETWKAYIENYEEQQKHLKELAKTEKK